MIRLRPKVVHPPRRTDEQLVQLWEDSKRFKSLKEFGEQLVPPMSRQAVDNMFKRARSRGIQLS